MGISGNLPGSGGGGGGSSKSLNLVASYQVTSPVLTIEFLGLDTTKFYFIAGENLETAADIYIYIQTSPDNGISWITSSYYNVLLNIANYTDGGMRIAYVRPARKTSFEGYLQGLSNLQMTTYIGNYLVSSSLITNVQYGSYGACRNSADTCNAIRIYATANITAGTISLYEGSLT